MKIPLRIKGTRNYIQGGDFFDGINSLLVEESILELSFRNFTLHECNLEKSKGDNTIASLKTNCNQYYINETNSLVVDKVDYKEELMIENSYFYGEVINLDLFVKGFTTIEHIIALTKELNNTLDPLDCSKWVFAQLKLTHALPDKFESITICSEQRIPKKFSKNKITIDGENVGLINFIVGEA